MAKKVQRKDLGKGLRALLSSLDDDQSTERNEVVKTLASNMLAIPIHQIEENPFQPRTEFDQEALDELVQSISTHGLIQPITVRRLSSNAYQLISGERRLRASKLAGLTEIPAYVRVANDQEMLEMALVENIQRAELNPIEIAISYQRLMQECDLSQELLSTRVGKKRSTVSNYVRLLKLPPQVQNELKNQNISMGHARALAGLENIDQQLTLLDITLKKQLSVRNLERMCNETKSNQRSQKSKSLPLEYHDLVERMKDHLGVNVDLKLQKSGSGFIRIPFKGTGELNRLLDHLTES